MADAIRRADDVARRALALFGVWGLTTEAPREEVLRWLRDNGLFAELSQYEAGFVDSTSPTRKQLIDVSWYAERLIVLLWALGLVRELPSANEECDTLRFQDCLPPFSAGAVGDFIQQSKLRPEDELLKMADACLTLHWEARDAKINGLAPKVPVDIEIIQERHHAINWVIGYDGLPWDEVTTDT